MKTFSLLILISFVTFYFSCSKNNVSYDGNLHSKLTLQINFSDEPQVKNFQKVSSIQTVRVTVTGSDMDKIVENLTLSGNTATGKITVPQGSSRKFVVEGLDDSGIVRFVGSQTKDLNSENESLTVNVHWLVPEPVNFQITEITPTSAKVTWDISNVNDFKFYRILKSTSKPLHPNNDAVQDINNRNIDNFVLTGLSSSTKYYVSVLVVDTENRTNLQGTPVKEFTTTCELPAQGIILG